MGVAALVLLAYIPVAVAIFAMLPPRRAFVWVVFGGFLFLPVSAITIPVLADYGKSTAPAYVALLCTLIFHPRLLLEYRPRWFDLPMAFWTVWQVVPSVANGHGWYDGLHQTMNFLGGWGLTYLLARCYFTRPEHLKEVALAVVGCVLVYTPLILFEMRMSPHLHFYLYGYHPAPFWDMMRMGGWRPVVFMQHGLALALLVFASAAIAGWVWWHRKKVGLTHVGPVPLGWVALGLAVLSVAMRSAGALLIFAFIASVMVASRGGRWKWVLAVPVVLMPLHIGSRLLEVSDGRWMLDVTEQIFPAQYGRGGSLDARLNQEDAEIPRILAKPWTGWSNWSTGQDQLWLLLARNTGLPSLAAWMATFSLPLLLCLRADLRRRVDLLVYGVPLGLVLVAWVMDGFFNGMYNPMWVVSAAAVMAAATSPVQVGRPVRAAAKGEGVAAAGRPRAMAQPVAYGRR